MTRKGAIVAALERRYRVGYAEISAKYGQGYPVCMAKDLAVLLFHTFGGMSLDEVAEEFGTTRRNVCYRLSRARKMARSGGRLAKDYAEIAKHLYSGAVEAHFYPSPLDANGFDPTKKQII